MKLFYKVTFREYNNNECIVINDGFVIFEDEMLYGYLTFDLLIGNYNKENNTLILEISDNNNAYHCYVTNIKKLILPEEYTLIAIKTKRKCTINFIEKITEYQKQEKIEMEFKKVLARYQEN